MTSFSEYAGLVSFDPATIATQQPVDVATARDNVVNNAAHLVQSSTQQRASWISVNGRSDNTAGGGTYGVSYLTALVGFDALAPMVCHGPFPLTIGPNGDAAKLVLRIGASVANGTATIRAAVSAYRGRMPLVSYMSGPGAPPATGGANVAEVTTASTTPVWLTPSPTYIQITEQPEIAYATRDVSTPTLAGGAASSAKVVMATLELWASNSDPSVPVVIHGVYAREYLG